MIITRCNEIIERYNPDTRIEVRPPEPASAPERPSVPVPERPSVPAPERTTERTSEAELLLADDSVAKAVTQDLHEKYNIFVALAKTKYNISRKQVGTMKLWTKYKERYGLAREGATESKEAESMQPSERVPESTQPSERVPDFKSIDEKIMSTAGLVGSASKGDYSKFAAIARKEGLTNEYLKDSGLWQRYKDKYLTKSDESPVFKRLIDRVKRQLNDFKVKRAPSAKRINELQTLVGNFEKDLEKYGDVSKLNKFQDNDYVVSLYLMSSANMPTKASFNNLIDDIVKLCDKL
jgi:hypothetical protein